MIIGASPTSSTWTLVAGGGLLVLYTIVLFVFDRCISTHPSRDLLVQTLDGLKDCAGWPRPPQGKERDRFNFVVGEVNAAVAGTKGQLQSWWNRRRARKSSDASASYAAFIDTGLVLAIWREAHRLDRLCWSVAPSGAVKEHLKVVTAQLAASELPEAKAIVARVAELEKPKPPSEVKPSFVLGPWTLAKRPSPTPSDPRPLLQEALTVFHNTRDTLFESYADTQAKASWFGILGVALIALAAITFHREYLLLFGALGALLSRSLRLLDRKPGGVYYGVSAAAFTLAPVIGALSGWAGVALVQALSQLGVLAKAFGRVWSYQTAGTLPLAIAFVFGFVERLIDRFTQSTVDAISPTAKSTKPTTPPKLPTTAVALKASGTPSAPAAAAASPTGSDDSGTG